MRKILVGDEVEEGRDDDEQQNHAYYQQDGVKPPSPGAGAMVRRLIA